MILKFDHIAYSCTRNEFEEIMKLFRDYSQVFLDRNLSNLDIKHSFMKYWCDTHDISLLISDYCLPVEITAYDQVGEGNKYEVDDDSIIVNTASLTDSVSFYKSIGFKDCNESEMVVKPIIGDKSIRLRFNELPNTVNYLDSAGYCCLAFVTNNAEKEKQKLDRKNIFTTDIKPLRVNNKQMKIFFSYNDFGDICEFISIEEERK